MEGNRSRFGKRSHGSQMKRKGSKRRGRSNLDDFSTGPGYRNETVYRILCPSEKIGGVIGKGGTIVKQLRETTHSKITVEDTVPGSVERIIMISSPPSKVFKDHSNEEDSTAENEQDPTMEPLCAAQDALMKVHDRIMADDLAGGAVSDEDGDGVVITTRLLVPDTAVGCILGKGGEVIQRLRRETGASVRVLSPDHLPTCASSNDELVQISGNPDVVKRALYEVSTLLHKNPPKERSQGFSRARGGQDFFPPSGPVPGMYPPYPMWPPHGMAPMPWMGKFPNQHTGFGHAGYMGASGHGETAEFSMKILCPADRIGGIIGTGGANVRQLEQSTGTSIHVEDTSPDAEERIIRISAYENLWNPRSQTIEAVLQLQRRASGTADGNTDVIRLLIPSGKVGCILGQGGSIINEMRYRTQADIKIFSNEDKPNYTSDDEELVQVSGNFLVVKEALVEILSRVRVRSIKGGKGGDAESVPSSSNAPPVQGYGQDRFLSGRPPAPAPYAAVSSSLGYDPHKDAAQDYGTTQNYAPQTAAGYQTVNHAPEANAANATMPSLLPSGTVPTANEAAMTRPKVQEQAAGAADHIAHENYYNAYRAAAPTAANPMAASYQTDMTAEQTAYQHAAYTAYQQAAYQQHMNPQQAVYQSQAPQQNPYMDAAQAAAYHQAAATAAQPGATYQY